MSPSLLIRNNSITYVRDNHQPFLSLLFSSFHRCFPLCCLVVGDQRTMRKSATAILPRSTSTHLPSIQRKLSSTSNRFPHSSSQHDCRKDLSTRPSISLRSRSTGPRSNYLTSATTHELSRLEPVLNIDTDMLKIGDRVYVNGQWSGIILYIGETTLGAGEWAGVILDDPSLGKTNGIVRGRCYFQTTKNRGIFCRLTKLTREKLLTFEQQTKRNLNI